MSYGEAASAIIINVDVGHLFKKFYKGLDADVLIWLSYDEDENSELSFLFKFWFESGCSNETTAVIFNSFIKSCVLPAKFHHSRGKMVKGSSIPGNPPTYEFYNPSFVARQFGLANFPLAYSSRTSWSRERILVMCWKLLETFNWDQTFLPFPCMTGPELVFLPTSLTPGGKNGVPISSVGQSILCV